MTARYRNRQARHGEITLIEVGDDQFEVERNRRSLLHVPADEVYARLHIRRVRLPDEKVILVDQQGHRRDITKEFARSR